MGYRSTFVSSHIDITWPEWFVRKYRKHVFFANLADFESTANGVIASKSEGKFYSPGAGLYADLLADVAKVEGTEHPAFSIVVLHEDNLVDRFTFKNGQVLKHQHDEVDNPQLHVTY